MGESFPLTNSIIFQGGRLAPPTRNVAYPPHVFSPNMLANHWMVMFIYPMESGGIPNGFQTWFWVNQGRRKQLCILVLMGKPWENHRKTIGNYQWVAGICKF